MSFPIWIFLTVNWKVSGCKFWEDKSGTRKFNKNLFPLFGLGKEVLKHFFP